ncbi:hypothetical protein JCM33374_g5033 [Metschnikowia sp. JCM 33374]|nr:hypothetical protein JCM33374_g5033 [Metschnikowia sp. JCM 33374]
MAGKDENSLTSWSDDHQDVTTDNFGIDDLDTWSPYDEDIDRFFGNINDLSNRASRAAKQVFGHTYNHPLNLPWFQSRDVGFSLEDDDKDQGSFGHVIDAFLNRPYQTRTEGLDALRSPFDLLNVFSESTGVTPFGLFAHQGPSPKQYNTCVKKDGVSLWDTDGYWRCLFPNSQIPSNFLEYKKKHLADQIVTKDDFEEKALSASPSQDGAIDLGKQGTFFRQFGDFLNWKNNAYEKEKRLIKEQQEKRQKNIQYMFGNNLGNSDRNIDGQKTLVGSSSNSSTNSEAGEVVVKETKTEYFSDGTSVTNSVVKRKPQGADTWSSVEENSEHGNWKKGWFWSTK